MWPPARGPNGAALERGLSHDGGDDLSHDDGDGYNHDCFSLALANAASSSGSPRQPHPRDWQWRRPVGDTAATARLQRRA